MKKVLLISLGLLCVAGAAFAGANSGAQAWLSWSATTQVTDTPATVATTTNLYVRFTRTGGLSFKGGEIDITWDPASDYVGCFDHTGTTYKTSTGSTCTYLNRGSAVPVVVADDASHFHVAWACPSASPTTCTAGAGIIIAMELDTCADPTGCISLNSAITIDSNNVQDVCSIGNAVVTVAGGGVHKCLQAVPVRSTTWGAVKNLYTR